MHISCAPLHAYLAFFFPGSGPQHGGKSKTDECQSSPCLDSFGLDSPIAFGFISTEGKGDHLSWPLDGPVSISLGGEFCLEGHLFGGGDCLLAPGVISLVGLSAPPNLPILAFRVTRKTSVTLISWRRGSPIFPGLQSKPRRCAN